MENDNNISNSQSTLISNRKGEVAIRGDSLIEARYQLSARANDIVDMVTLELKDDDNLTYTIAFNNYNHYVINKKNIYREFKKVVNEFKGQGVFIKKGTGKETFYPWFSKIDYEEGIISVDLHPDMKNILISASRGIYYDIKYSINLTNAYAKKYYYCCKLYSTSNSDNKSGFRIDRLEDLQLKLEVPESYKKRFALFETNVLEVAKNQINELSDIKIEYEPIKKGRRVVSIHTRIWQKSKEELAEVSSKILNIKHENIIDTKKDESIRLQVLNLLKPYDNIVKEGLQSKKGSIERKKFVEIKKFVEETLCMTIRNVNRYIYINYLLLKEFVEMFDKNFITLGQAEKLAKTSINEQQKQLKKINSNKEKFKSKLINELADLLDNYEISYNIAEKYSKEPEEEQRKYYEKYFKRINIIDVDYKEVDYKEVDESTYKEVAITSDEINDIINDNYSESNKELGMLVSRSSNNSDSYITTVKNIIQSINNIEITDDVAMSFYNCAKEHKTYGAEPFKLIREVAEYSLTQNITQNFFGWYKKTLKNFERPVIQVKSKAKLRFDNFKGRDYDYDDLEKKLLGWDEE